MGGELQKKSLKSGPHPRADITASQFAFNGHKPSYLLIFSLIFQNFIFRNKLKLLPGHGMDFRSVYIKKDWHHP